MQLILTVLAAVLLTGCGVVTYRAAPVRGRLEVRLVARAGAPGGERVRRFFGEETLRLERAVILGTSEVREVHLEDAPDGHRYVVLHLTDTGRRRLADATGRHLGRRLAILVGGRVVVAPTIRTPIDEGIAHISVGDEGQIEQVFEALTQGARAHYP